MQSLINTNPQDMQLPLQSKPPKPSNPDVNIESAGSETFAVSQFGGFLVDDYTLSTKAKALQVNRLPSYNG